MKNKKIGIIFFIALIIVLIVGYFLIQYFKNKEEKVSVEEYTPQEEITDEQIRQTIVSLYFPSEENQLKPEARLIDIKDIINNPYEQLINLLIEGPKNEKNKKVIPENTKLNKTYLEGDCVVLDFSSEILNYSKENKNAKNNIINSIVNTLTELTEVNKVKILINGKENDEFKEIYEREKIN